MEPFASLATLATMVVLPLFGYLIVRRDTKIEALDNSLRAVQLDLAKAGGPYVTKVEFDATMGPIAAALSDIKRKLSGGE